MFSMTEKSVVYAPDAPAAIGPYSVATRFQSLVFTAGQVGIDPATGELIADDIEAQTRQALTNIKNVLEAAGSSLNEVLKTTVFLKNMQDFSRMNRIYAEFFPQDPPARSTVEVCALPKGALIEIEAIACRVS